MKPKILTFPNNFTMSMPSGGELAFYPSEDEVCLMHWDRHGDSGFCVGTFRDWAEAIAAAVRYQAKLVAELEASA